MDWISEMIAPFMSRDNSAPSDYIDNAGFRCCGICHERKQAKIQWPFNGILTPVTVTTACKCETDAYYNAFDGRREQQEREIRIKQLKRDGLTDPQYMRWVFEADDKRYPAISAACRGYVAGWDKARAENTGIVMCGGVGTGKTFFACCIANALLDNSVQTLVTSFPRILSRLQSSNWDERNEMHEKFRNYELIVIDDLGVERTTDYGMEQVYSVVDDRYRSGLPLIVTTNLTPAELRRPANIGYERIFDRILENCGILQITGKSRRAEKAESNQAKINALMEKGGTA